jgi:hypothetical protein
VLAHGRLHELAVSIEALSASEISDLPPGQRDLLVSKIADIVSSDDPSLQYPSERFLELLLIKGIFLPEEDYRDIALPAISWAFERVFDDGRLGRGTLRAALEEAAFIARGPVYKVLCGEFILFLKTARFDDKENWYLQAIREVIMALMANLSCGEEESKELNSSLRVVNKSQRKKH